MPERSLRHVLNIPDGVVMTHHDEILTDLLESYAAIPTCAPDQLDQFYQNMGFWLVRVTDEEVYSRWVLRFITAIHAKYGPGFPVTVVSWFVQERIAQALERHP